MMRILSLSLFFLLFLFFVPAAGEAQSPFQAPPQQEKQEGREREDRASFSPGNILPVPVKEGLNKARAGIFLLQAQIRQKAATYARRIQENPWGGAFWSYLGLAFVYGVIHALGPGHGKVFVTAWFLSRRSSPAEAAMAGGLISTLHVLSAVMLVMILYFVLTTGVMGSLDQAGRHMQSVSAALISLVGLYLAWKSGRTLFRGKAVDSDPQEESEHGDRRSLLSLALVVGLVPCPGAALILFFSITLGILPAGLVAMVFLAAGLAVTTTFFALASMATRNLLGSALDRVAPISHRLYVLPAFVGAVIIILLGTILFFNPLKVP